MVELAARAADVEVAGMESKPPVLVMLAGMVVVFAIAAAAVPLMIKLVVDFQVRHGNGEVPLVKFLGAHRMHITYIAWGVYVLGLVVALPAMIKDGFFSASPSPIAPPRDTAPRGAQPPLEHIRAAPSHRSTPGIERS